MQWCLRAPVRPEPAWFLDSDFPGSKKGGGRHPFIGIARQLRVDPPEGLKCNVLLAKQVDTLPADSLFPRDISGLGYYVHPSLAREGGQVSDSPTPFQRGQVVSYKDCMVLAGLMVSAVHLLRLGRFL